MFFDRALATPMFLIINVFVVYRDLKAENVVLHEDGSYKLCDLGSADLGNRELALIPDGNCTRLLSGISHPSLLMCWLLWIVVPCICTHAASRFHLRCA